MAEGNVDVAPPASKEALIAAYKRLLQAYIDLRPSGTRLKIATAIGKHKSFVSQITNPAYAVPLPEAHVPTILAICHFSPEEREAFLDAYVAAHPNRAARLARGEATVEGPRHLVIDVPQFDDPHLQHEVEETIQAVAQRIIRLARGASEDS